MTIALTAPRLALGAHHSCAYDPAGAMHCWGDNSYGQLGDGTNVSQPRPTVVARIANASHASAGRRFTCAIVDGAALCWGDNHAGQLGDGTTSHRGRPEPVVGLPPVVRIAAGGTHACAIAVDGGSGAGDATAPGSWATARARSRRCRCTYRTSSPTSTRRRSPPTAITPAIAPDANLYCWGNNNNGQLGDGTARDRSEPTRIGVPCD